MATGVRQAEIRYTTDGTEPGVTSTLYRQDFSPDNSMTIRARCSKDGRPVGGETIQHSEPTEYLEDEILRFSVNLHGNKARFIRIKAKNTGHCPEWHQGAGGKAWLFTDEIIIE